MDKKGERLLKVHIKVALLLPTLHAWRDGLGWGRRAGVVDLFMGVRVGGGGGP